MSALQRHWETGGVSKVMCLDCAPDTMHLGGWRDMKSVKRYMGLLQKDRLKLAAEAAWTQRNGGECPLVVRLLKRTRWSLVVRSVFSHFVPLVDHYLQIKDRLLAMQLDGCDLEFLARHVKLFFRFLAWITHWPAPSFIDLPPQESGCILNIRRD